MPVAEIMRAQGWLDACLSNQRAPSALLLPHAQKRDPCALAGESRHGLDRTAAKYPVRTRAAVPACDMITSIDKTRSYRSIPVTGRVADELVEALGGPEVIP